MEEALEECKYLMSILERLNIKENIPIDIDDYDYKVWRNYYQVDDWLVMIHTKPNFFSMAINRVDINKFFYSN